MFENIASKVPHNSNSIETEKRLLEAAGEIFAHYGYRAATVRQICEKAGANLAAVNYHFGDKEGLYLAVLRSVPNANAEKYPSSLGLGRGRLQTRSCAPTFSPYCSGFSTKVVRGGTPSL